MTNKLEVYFASKQNIGHERLAFWTVILLIAVFFRNIHGNARYDDFREKTRCVIWFEQSLKGRFGTFCLAILALFLGPSLAGQIFTHYLTPCDDLRWLYVPLFLPFIFYAIWDLMLFYSISECRQDGLCLTDVALNWNKLNAIAAMIMINCFFYKLILESNGENISPMFVCWAFIVVAVIIVGGDYYFNRAFYFAHYNQNNR